MRKPTRSQREQSTLDDALQRQLDAIRDDEIPEPMRRLARRLQTLLDEEEPPK